MHENMVTESTLRSLLIVLTLCKLAQACVLLYVGQIHKDYPPAREWGYGALLAAVGFLLVSMREVLPPWASVVVGNCLLISGTIVFDFGILHASGRRPPWLPGMLAGLIAAGFVFWFAMIEHKIFFRTVGYNVTIMAFDAWAIFACITSSRKPLAPTLRLIALTLFLSLLSCSYKVFGAPAIDMTSHFSPVWSQWQYLVVAVILTLAMTPLLVLLASQTLQEKLNDLARHDPLTGAINRRSMEEIVVLEWPRAIRHDYPVSCLMMDLDHFKNVNDRHGHRMGDLVLRQASLAARAVLRSEDTWCRYGGEEFVALLPQTNAMEAEVVAQRLRKSIEAFCIHGANGPFGVTASIGVADCLPSATSWEGLVEHSDQALYRAKHNGRNRVEVTSLAGTTSGTDSSHGSGFVRLIWRTAYEYGHKEIDGQHRHLFEGVNALMTLVLSGRPKKEWMQLLEGLLTEVTEHFSTEERFFREAGYPRADEHTRLHDQLAKQALELTQKCDHDMLTPGEIIGFFAHDVVAKHLFREDRKMFDWINGEKQQAEAGASLSV